MATPSNPIDETLAQAGLDPVSPPASKDQILAAIGAVFDESTSYATSIAGDIDAMIARHPGALQKLRMQLTADAADCVNRMIEGHPDDWALAMRAVAVELQCVASFLVGAMKRQGGEILSPARFALVAYEVAQNQLPIWKRADEGRDTEGPGPKEYAANWAWSAHAAVTKAAGGYPCYGCGKPSTEVDVNGLDLCRDCAEGCKVSDDEAAEIAQDLEDRGFAAGNASIRALLDEEEAEVDE